MEHAYSWKSSSPGAMARVATPWTTAAWSPSRAPAMNSTFGFGSALRLTLKGTMVPPNHGFRWLEMASHTIS